MKKTQKRAFILNECNSPYISQAIFILKSGVNECDSGVLADAERIVSAYMCNKKNPRKPKHSLCISLSAAVILTIGIISAIIYFT